MALNSWRSTVPLRPLFSKHRLCRAGVFGHSITSHATVNLPRHHNTIARGEPAHTKKTDFVSSDTELVGESGRHYLIEQILQQKGHSPYRVCLARAGEEKFVLKDVPASHFDDIRSLYHSLNNDQYLRVSEDVIVGRPTFVYRYHTDHLLSFAQQDLSLLIMKRILRDALRGLASLHQRNIVHTDIKANNILVDWNKDDRGISVQQVKLADIEDATHVDANSDIVGVQVGNLMWRSPESHTQARVNKPSDMFSFGIVCIYVMTKQVIFAVDETELEEGVVEHLAVILERQISYFADEDGMSAFLKYLGDSPWCRVLEVLRDGFNKTNPRKPISLWKGVDEDFKDLIMGLTKFNPAQRITAEEALKHRWFADVE